MFRWQRWVFLCFLPPARQRSTSAPYAPILSGTFFYYMGPIQWKGPSPVSQAFIIFQIPFSLLGANHFFEYLFHMRRQSPDRIALAPGHPIPKQIPQNFPKPQNLLGQSIRQIFFSRQFSAKCLRTLWCIGWYELASAVLLVVPFQVALLSVYAHHAGEFLATFSGLRV